MNFTSEQHLDDGILERGFMHGDVPGILWTPPSPPAPLILMGHPGGLRGMYPRLAARARMPCSLCPTSAGRSAIRADRSRSASAWP